MADVVQHVLLQQYGTGDEVALALKEYSGMLLHHFLAPLVAMPLTVKKYPVSGSSEQFPATARVEAYDKVAGAQLLGSNQPEMEERLVTVDSKEIVADQFYGEVQTFIAHYDVRAQAAELFAQAIGVVVEGRILRTALLGARQAARGTGADEFPAGTRKLAGTAGAVATAYPNTLTGSNRLQDDLEYIGRTMDEKHVPDNDRVAILSPYLRDVLLKDKTIQSKDFIDGENRLLTQVLTRVKRFRIEMSTLVPSTNVTTGPTNSRGDFTKSIVLCVATNDAIGQIIYGGGIRPIGPSWEELVQMWVCGAKMLQGTKWLRPESLGEVYLQ